MEVGVAGSGRNAARRHASDEAVDGRNPYNLRRSRTARISCATVARPGAADLDDCTAADGSDSRRVREAIAALAGAKFGKGNSGQTWWGGFFTGIGILLAMIGVPDICRC